MIVNLYSVRLLWNILGVDNYGIYNLVAGIVLMFAFLNNAMIASSQRFIAYELGYGVKERLKRTFSISVRIHLLLAIIVLLLSESLGLWFVNTELNIPESRIIAANWVYQCSVFTFILSIVSVPYNACIVAHEHMNIYGYLGVLDVILKFIVVLILVILPFDKLISYSVMILIEALIMRIIYGLYCNYHFEECKLTKVKDPDLMKNMFSFAGWSFVGNLGISLKDQGLNIILNMFFNVAVNAAKGIATQVSSLINGFVFNFSMALNPQITKRYALGNIESMLDLVYMGCKYSLLLMSLISIPLIICITPILSLWLKDVAPYTAGFIQLGLLLALIESVVSPITSAIQATGNIKIFQILISIIMVLNLPMAWVWLSLKANPYIVSYVCFITSIIAIIARLVLLHNLVDISYKKFINIVYSRTIPYLLFYGILSFCIYNFYSDGIFGLIGYLISSVIIGITLIFLIVLNIQEKNVVFNYIKSRLKKSNHEY